MRSGLSRSLDDNACTEEQWRIQHVLSDQQKRSMGDLAEQVLMNRSALTKCIDKLVGRGLVQRTADESDSRRVLVRISTRGLKMAIRMDQRVDAHHEAIEPSLGPLKTAQLKKLLEDFIDQTCTD